CELIFELNPGDMIYVPAGVAHWGTAVTDDCITLSVGFRAPSDKQLICQTLENLLEYFSDSSDQETCFYQDTTSSMDLISAKINQNAHLSIDNLLTSLTPEILQAESHRAFGQLVTEPRQRVEIEYDKEWTAKEVENLLKSSNFIAITQLTHSRLAFSEDTLFVNGQTYTVAESFSNMLCDGGISRLLSENEMDIFLELLNQGAITIN
ncbi:MAG: 50S ribosomal protein L16 3-hydroxylase, partial [Gammaproteobacteria bacterium]